MVAQRLPIPGKDDGTWGDILNGFLAVAHNADGSLNPGAVSAAGAGTYSKPSTGIPTSDLDTATQTAIASVASKYTKPAGGIPGSDIASGTITDANIASSAAIAASKLDSATQTNLAKAASSVQSVNTKTPSSGNVTINVADIADVQGGSGATNNQVLVYNSGTTKWIPGTVSSTTVGDATTGAKGIVQLAGDIAAGTAAAPQVTSTHLSSALPVNQGGTGSTTQNFVDLSTTQTIAGAKTFSTIPTLPVTTPTNGTDAASKAYVDGQITSGTTPDATTTSKGKVQLAGDLSGTAASPTVAKVNGITLPASAPSIGNVLTAASATTTTWTTPAAGVTLDTTAGDIQADTTTGSALAGSTGKAADAGHQHPLVAHDHTTTNKGGQIPVAGLSATGTASSTTFLRGDGSWTTPAAGFSDPTTTKGDLIIHGTSTTRQPIGSDGQVLTADSTQATGAKWATPSTTDTTKLAIASNLSDLNNAGTARTNLGLGGAATLNVGTTSGTVAAGDDSRFSNAATALTAVAVQTTIYSASANQLVPCDATSGAFTVTLPTAPADKTRLVIKKIDTSANVVTIAAGGSDVFNKAGGSTAGSLSLQNQALTIQYAATPAIWYVSADDLPLSQLDARYAPVLNTQLKAWTYVQAYQLVSATRDSNEAITTASVAWPDGSTGTFTTDTASTSFPGAIDAYHVTYVPATGATKTITQAAVTRDAAGSVTAQPALTIT